MEVFVVKGEWDTYNGGFGSESILFSSLEKAEEKLDEIFEDILSDFEENPTLTHVSEKEFSIEFEKACCSFWYEIVKQEVL
ncbi:MAG: hypothetical protein ACRC0G_16615 [Fusobacteriaceae bacterium]